MQRDYDILVWGATGFTGKLVTEYMHEHYGGSNVSWAVGGRSQAKLDELVADRDIAVHVADAHDTEAMDELVQKARVVLTTVGPYARLRLEARRGLRAHGTHYCDLTGELHWMRQMIASTIRMRGRAAAPASCTPAASTASRPIWACTSCRKPCENATARQQITSSIVPAPSRAAPAAAR